MTIKPYPTDLTDAEWDLIKDLIPPPKPGGRQWIMDRHSKRPFVPRAAAASPLTSARQPDAACRETLLGAEAPKSCSMRSQGMASRPHKLRVPDEVVSLIRPMHPQLKRKVRAALQAMQTDPAVGKPLKEELADLCSFRISRFRVIYRVMTGPSIDIVAIGPRRSIYEETYRIISRQEREL